MKSTGAILVLVAMCTVPGLAQQRALPSATADPLQTTAVPAPPASSTASQTTDALPRMYIELWNTGNFDLLKSVLPSPAYMNSHGRRVVMDQAMLKRVITAWRNSMPDLNLKIEDTIAQGEKIAVRLTLTGSYQAILFPNTAPPASSAPAGNIHATEMLMFLVKDGKIQELWEEYDEVAMRSQMGGVWRIIPEAAALGPRH